MEPIEVIGAAPLTRRTLWTVRMLNRRKGYEVWVAFGIEFDDGTPGLIRMFPTRITLQVVDQAPPSAFIDIDEVPAVATRAWVKRAFSFARKKVLTREDYLTTWGPAPARLRVVLEGPRSRP